MIRRTYTPGLCVTNFIVVSDFPLTALHVHIYVHASTCTHLRVHICVYTFTCTILHVHMWDITCTLILKITKFLIEIGVMNEGFNDCISTAPACIGMAKAKQTTQQLPAQFAPVFTYSTAYQYKKQLLQKFTEDDDFHVLPVNAGSGGKMKICLPPESCHF